MSILTAFSSMINSHREKLKNSQLALLRRQAEDAVNIEYSLGIIAITINGLPVFKVVDAPSANDELTASQAERKVMELRDNYIKIHE